MSNLDARVQATELWNLAPASAEVARNIRATLSIKRLPQLDLVPLQNSQMGLNNHTVNHAQKGPCPSQVGHSEPRFVLQSNEAHVWLADLNKETRNVTTLIRVLSSDERQRAESYRFRRDWEHFVAARAIARSLIAHYLKIRPSQVEFAYDDYGKPHLRDIELSKRLSFNVSHSNGFALYAMRPGDSVGVDIELIREDFADIKIAESFFSVKEVAALRALPASQRTTAFFNCWTRKEAYIKALGEGLSHPLKQFTVSVEPNQSPLLLAGNEANDHRYWSLSDLSVADGYVAALAVEGKMPVVRQWNWNSQARRFIDWS